MFLYSIKIITYLIPEDSRETVAIYLKDSTYFKCPCLTNISTICLNIAATIIS